MSNQLFEEIPVIMKWPFFGHRQDNLLHILDLNGMVNSNWDLVKCGKIGRFQEATGKMLELPKCERCWKK